MTTPDPIRALITTWREKASDGFLHSFYRATFRKCADELEAALLTAPPAASWCPNGVWRPEGKITFNAVLSKADADQLCADAPPTEPTT